MTEIDISPKKDGGVLKQILKEGTGSAYPPHGSQVIVHYTGTLMDGTKFDSSRDRDYPFEFDLGLGKVIRGWDIGVASMKKNERAILTCAPDYAYGGPGSPPNIPPNSTLKFDVEVLDWKSEDLSPDKDGSIQRVETLIAGDGVSMALDGAQVQVHLTGIYEGKPFEDRDITFNLGEGCEVGVVEGVEIALLNFKMNESSKLLIMPKYAFGLEGSKEFNIPPNATVEYIVTLKTFERLKDSWALDGEERLEQCKLFKDKGTNYFKQGNYNLAIKLYKRIQNFLESNIGFENELGQQRNALLLASHLNISLCHLKLKDNFEARVSANKALELDPKNEKALFRRGQALMALNEAQLAAKDFEECLQIDSTNQAAKAQQKTCSKILKQELAKEKQIYANMFDKFAKMDAQREESEKEKEPNVMSCVGEWGKEDREREPSEFEKENPNILLLNSGDEFRDM